MAPLFQLLSYAIGLLAPAVALIGGVWALNRLRSADLRARADRPRAIRIVVITVIVATLLATIVAGSLTTMFSSNGPNYLIALPYGAVFGAFIGLAGVLGYVLRARRGPASGATSGVVVGPVILIAAAILGAFGSVALQQAASGFDESQRQEGVSERSSRVHATVEVVNVRSASGGTIAGVDLLVTLSTDVALRFDPALKEPDPHFRLLPADSSATLEALAPSGAPTNIEAGGSHQYELVLNYPDEIIHATSGTYVPGRPGSWTLEISFVDPEVGEYLLQIPVEVH